MSREIIKELEKINIDLINKVLDTQNFIYPMIIYSANNEIKTFILDGNAIREGTKFIIERLSKKPLDWLVHISEAYCKIAEREASYKYGELERRFDNGDKDVKEIVFCHIYTKTDKLSITIDKKSREIMKSSEFEGFLTISDNDRVLWKD